MTLNQSWLYIYLKKLLVSTTGNQKIGLSYNYSNFHKLMRCITYVHLKNNIE